MFRDRESKPDLKASDARVSGTEGLLSGSKTKALVSGEGTKLVALTLKADLGTNG